MGDIVLGLAALLVIGWNVFEWKQSSDLSSHLQSGGSGPVMRDVASGEATRPVARDSRVRRGDRGFSSGRRKEESESDDHQFAEEVRRMSTSGIVDALRDLFGASRGEREQKVGWLMEELVRRDPVKALEVFQDHIGDEDVSWYLADALGQWAARDVVAAAAWLDSRIEAGSFESRSLDGRSVARIEFEGALTAALLGFDPAAAARRIGSLPEGQRAEVLDSIDFTSMGSEARRGFVSIVRSLLPEAERAGVFSQVAAALSSEEGYGGVDGFLAEIRATPVERGIVASETAAGVLAGIVEERSLTRADLDEMRSWLGVQSPEAVDRITGEALGLAASEDGDFDFERATGWVLAIRRESGNDAVLVSFLESFAAVTNPDRALELAEGIRDPEVRARVVGRLK